MKRHSPFWFYGFWFHARKYSGVQFWYKLKIESSGIPELFDTRTKPKINPIRMCTRCKDKITTFTSKHNESVCPLYASYYCSFCAKKGHLLSACPRKYIAKSVKPVVLEEIAEPIMKRTLEIKDNDAVIAAYLSARGYETGRKASENREILAEYAASEGMKLVREWSLKIIMPDGQETRASVTNTLSFKELLASLEGRGYDLPTKVVFASNGKIITSLDKLTCKSTLNIIARP
jgi:hypothetical protein